MLFEERLGGEERRLMHLVPARPRDSSFVPAVPEKKIAARKGRNRLAQEIDGVRKEKERLTAASLNKRSLGSGLQR
jgi:hypothetical protein